MSVENLQEEKESDLFEHNIRQSDGTPLCSICSQPIDAIGPPGNEWRGGHNAVPINNGRCCSSCNDKFVIVARLLRIYQP